MSRSSLLALAAALAALVPARPADACGPDFPVELLADRTAALGGLPEGIFADEAAALVPADPRLAGPPRGLAPPTPIERELYARGAAAFHAGDAAAAARWFQAVLALPPAWRRQRAAAAAYSLGRLDAAPGARVWFRTVRALVIAGAVDPDGLAAASLREEAWRTEGLATLPLWAQRAALGDDDARVHLLAIVRDAIADRTEDALLAREEGQRLLAAYLYARDDELTDGERARLWRAIEARPTMAGADRLAAAAYRAGDFARAEALVARAEPGPVRDRVAGKLAARRGDVAAAAALTCRAAEALPTTTRCAPEVCGEYRARYRALAECAILELRTGDHVAAMRHAWGARATYRDALYIAERVLTLDELRGFLAELASAPAADLDEAWYLSPDSLGRLYGRRLMRAGRHDEAVAWLTGADRLAALIYAGELRRARTGDRFARAQALFEASIIARRSGLELLGTEHHPDWATWGADYDLDGYTTGHDSGIADTSAPWDDEDEAAPEAAPAGPSPWVGPVERARVAASAPGFDARFHYRVIASRQAEAAADLLPTTSQAYAATLCWAARHVRRVDPARADDLYVRYLATGPSAVSMSFGEDCPAPDFARARQAPPRRPAPTASARRWWHRYPRWCARARLAARHGGPVVIVAALGGVLALLVRRRQRRFAARA